jgi:hypothetical protein|tara:strand:- start:29 stop:391 length:363 start_codon:yes stop_codon:yes gene_type:complete
MKKFKLYQIHTTKEEDDLINAEGHDAVHKHKMHLDMTFRNKEDTGSLAKQAFDLGYYSHVSNVTAKNIEDVFSVGNVGPESQIERFANTSMYSVSVGDIVEDKETNKKFVVASMGFKEVA